MSKLITQNDLKNILNNVLPIDDDSGWINMELTSTFLPYGSTSINAYRKVGNVVTVIGEIKPAADIAGSDTLLTICTLPEGYRPKSYVSAIMQGSGGATWLFQILSNGELKFARYRSGGSYATCTTTNWLPFYATFLVADANPKSGPGAGASGEINVDDFTEEELDDFVEELDVSGIPAVDYIVEQGTSGIWKYRKWNSGLVELWGVSSQTVSYTANSYAAGGYRASTAAISFPFTLSTITNATATPYGTSSNYYAAVSNIIPTTSNVTIALDRGATGTNVVTAISISVLGTWK